MNKGIILGLTNSDDSVWFRIKPDKNTISNLENIFFLHDAIGINEGTNESKSKVMKYSFWINKHLKLENPKMLAYIIFSEKTTHIILRKIKNYELVKNNILERFEFKEKK